MRDGRPALSATCEADPLGVVGALQNALPWLSDPFLFVYSDVYPSTPVRELIAALGLDAGRLMATSVYRGVGREPCNVSVHSGLVASYGKLDDGLMTTHVDAAMTAVRHRAVDRPLRVLAQEEHLFRPVATAGAVAAVEVADAPMQIGNPAAYESARRRLAQLPLHLGGAP